MPTNDEIRAMIERLDGTICRLTADEAALMLRSILAEREAKIEALPAEFQTAIYSDVEGLYEK